MSLLRPDRPAVPDDGLDPVDRFDGSFDDDLDQSAVWDVLADPDPLDDHADPQGGESDPHRADEHDDDPADGSDGYGWDDEQSEAANDTRRRPWLRRREPRIPAHPEPAAPPAPPLVLDKPPVPPVQVRVPTAGAELAVPAPRGELVDPPTAELDLRHDDPDDVPDDGTSADSGAEQTLDVWQPPSGPVRDALQRFAGRQLPTRAIIAKQTKWWLVLVVALTPRTLIWALPWLIVQVRPITVGLIKVLHSWSAWRIQAQWDADIREIEDKNKKAAARERYQNRRRGRAVLSLIVVVVAIIAAIVGFTVWPLYSWLVLGCAVTWLDWHGRRRSEDGEHRSFLPAGPLREGAPVRMVMTQVTDTLAGLGKTATAVNGQIGEFGITMDLHSNVEIVEKDIEALERSLQAFPGAVSRVQDPTNAAVGKLRVMWTDPLAQIHPVPWRAPLSCTVNDPGDLGYGVGGVDLLMNFLRTNILVVGGPGSGKSSCFWCMVDYLTACDDVVLDGIDLSGGPALTSWGDCIRKLATTPDEAEEVLQDALQLSDERTRKIAGRSRPQRGRRATGSENWGTSDGRAHIILIDELPLMAAHDGKGGGPNLLGLYSEHQRVGRKAASTSVAATQDLSGGTLNATSLRKYPSTTVLLPCSREDVVTALGGGKIKEGWCPHRFIPAEGDNPNDAGKAFIHSGLSRVATPWRFNRLSDIGEIHERALDRIDAGRPTLDDADAGDDIIDAAVIPDDLNIFYSAFANYRWPDFLATDHILAHREDATGKKMSRNDLSAIAKNYGFATEKTRKRSLNSPNPLVGYSADAVRGAVKALEMGVAA